MGSHCVAWETLLERSRQSAMAVLFIGRFKVKEKKMSEKNVRAADHDSYGLFSILALILPVVGIILGIIMLTKDDKVDKKLGEHTLVCSIFGFILAGIFWVVIAGATATNNVV